MINFRFHLVSLIAVFLAMGLGILVGSTVVDQVIVDRLDKEIRDVRRDSNSIRAQDSTLRSNINGMQDFLRSASPFMVETRLQGSSVALIVDRGVDDAAAKATLALLRSAGADVPGILWLADSWRLDDAHQLTQLQGAAHVSGNAAAARADALRKLVGRLDALRSSASSTSDTLTRLADAGFVQQTDAGDADLRAFPANPVRVLIMTGTDSRLSGTETLVDLVTALTHSRVPTVVGEVYNNHGGATPVPDRGGALAPVRGDGTLSNEVSTLDDMEMLQGQVGAVLALDQIGAGIVGHYGYGANVTAPLPAPTS